VAKRKPSLSTVVAFMSEDNREQVREQAGGLSLLPLLSIRPDPRQPRQLLPSALTTAVSNGDITPQSAVESWGKLAKAKDASSALIHNWQELERLAQSIAQHGLINPVSVQRVRGEADLPEGVKYLIVTGERRYWAHMLLLTTDKTIQEGVETQSPDRIKATITSEGVSIRAHQIIENLLREDIDAIEKANGFVALRNELSDREGGNHGSPLVAWRQVEQAVGVSKRYRSYVTSVLGLSEEAQALIHQHRLTERMVRPISQKLKKNPDLQMTALKQLVVWQQENEADEGGSRPLTASVEALVSGLLDKESRQQVKSVQSVVAGVDAGKLHNKTRAVSRILSSMSDADRVGLVEALSQSENNLGVVADLRVLEEQITMLLDAVDAQWAEN